MRPLLALTALMLAACATPVPAPLPEADSQTPAVAASRLNGTWDVALFYSPTEPPSATVMVLDVSADGTLTGSFYESPFLEANYSVRGSTLAFGTVTTDGAALYSHSGRLVDGRIEGQTLSHGRDFLMTWIATRRPNGGSAP